LRKHHKKTKISYEPTEKVKDRSTHSSYHQLYIFEDKTIIFYP